MTRFLLTLGLFLLLITFPQSSFASEAKGDWTGTLEVNATTKLPLVAHIKAAEAGLQGTLASPGPGAFGIPLADVASAGGKLSFNVPAVGGRYEASWDEAKKAWVGQWSQGGPALPL